MKSIKILFISLFLGITSQLPAQEYLAYNNSEMKNELKTSYKESKDSKPAENKYTWELLSAIPPVINENEADKSGNHDFGKRIAGLKTLMDKYYITKEDVIPGDPMMRTIVLNPNIYYTVRKIEKYLKKEVRNGGITTEDASLEMEHVLKVSLSVINSEEVTSFEAALNKNKKSIEAQIELFQQVKLQNIYR